ncbi:MAG: tetratricopeptide repeat protein [Thermoguttaceae bacterium]|jgi:tetratricopeptide (TPR) repeat protein
MPWVELLILMAVIYVVVLVIWGIIQFMHWFIENFVEPRRLARPENKFKLQPDYRESASLSPSIPNQKEDGIEASQKGKVALPVLSATSQPTGLLEFLKRLFKSRDFTYWVGSALGEINPDKKVQYCSKALRLNPGYEPAWGLKANSLLELKRYEEAVPCFDKVLEMRPHSMAWYKKGLCCYNLRRHEEAINCFDKALVACAAKDRQLSEEISRYKKLAKEAMLSEDSEYHATP